MGSGEWGDEASTGSAFQNGKLRMENGELKLRQAQLYRMENGKINFTFLISIFRGDQA